MVIYFALLAMFWLFLCANSTDTPHRQAAEGRVIRGLTVLTHEPEGLHTRGLENMALNDDSDFQMIGEWNISDLYCQSIIIYD